MAIEQNELRRVMGHFATGVTVVTSRRNSGELHGLTANAFTSVSLVPPLALICVDKKAESYPCFEESKIFTVNVLAHDPEALSRKFAVSGGNKFEGVSHKIGANGAPTLDGGVLFRECKVPPVSEGGHHAFYMGGVERAKPPRGGKPLLFFRG